MTAFLVALATLPAIDALFRLVLLWRSRRGVERPATAAAERRDSAARWLVVIPSRDEGEHVRRTIESVRGATVLLLLDGEDAMARRVAAELGAEAIVKAPAGPTKAAALAWLATTQRERLLGFTAILVLDVGSVAGPQFFQQLEWPESCAAIQARLRGVGAGVGAAVAASETQAQLDEDRGRESLGWSVRLRGTGSAFRPATFLDISTRLRTRVEDLEATLLMIARGERVALGAPDAFVSDDKPPTVYSAASQRARWLLGRYEVLFKCAGDFLRAFVRKPGEATALFFEIFGRPLSLTVPFRVVVAAIAMVKGEYVVWSSAILATAAVDATVFLASGRSSASSALRLMAAWALAVVLAPRALFRWMRAKRL